MEYGPVAEAYSAALPCTYPARGLVGRRAVVCDPGADQSPAAGTCPVSSRSWRCRGGRGRCWAIDVHGFIVSSGRVDNSMGILIPVLFRSLLAHGVGFGVGSISRA